MLERLKRLFDSSKYNAGSVRMLDTSGPKGSAYPPFNYTSAVKSLHSWIYAATWINASAVAATPLRLYARNRSQTKSMWRTRSVSTQRKSFLMGDGCGDQRPSSSVMTKVMDLGEDMVEVTEMHPVIEVLRKANGVYNGFDLTLLRTMYQELTGNAYLHPIFDDTMGIPTELWPMPSQWVSVIPSRDSFIDGYVYGSPDQEQFRFERDEVIHFRRPNPNNLYYGLGKVEAAYGAVKANHAVHEMDLAVFENHARPDYAVVVNGPARRSDLDIFEQHVGDRLRGTRKSGQFLAVSGDVTFQPLNFPPKDLSGREEIVEEIAAVFGVPVSMLKANDPNLASARAGFAQWRESTILPLLRIDEDVLNQVLLPLFGIEDDAVLAYDNPVPGDKAFELQERQAAVAGGWMTLNEARKQQGMEDDDNPLADQLLFNGQPLGAAAPDPFGLATVEEPVQQQQPELEVEEQDYEYVVEEQDKSFNVVELQGVLTGVADATIAPHAAISIVKHMGIDDEEAEEMVMSQVVLAQNTLRRKAYETTQMDIFATKEEALERAAELGCEGFHEHEGENGETLFMPCSEMDDYTDITGLEHSKAIADVDTKPSEQMADLAERGLEMRREYKRGGTQIGVSRARDIKNRENLSPETIKRMHAFFERHRVDLQAPAAQRDHKDYPSAGVIAWLLWGGDPNDSKAAGAAWAKRKIEEIENATGKAIEVEEE